jgi:hypothetical protein
MFGSAGLSTAVGPKVEGFVGEIREESKGRHGKSQAIVLAVKIRTKICWLIGERSCVEEIDVLG